MPEPDGPQWINPGPDRDDLVHESVDDILETSSQDPSPDRDATFDDDEVGSDVNPLSRFLSEVPSQQEFIARLWMDEHPDKATPWKEGVVGGGQPLAHVARWKWWRT